jgi:tetratricopeptide (TPR) repeat protein
LRQAVELIGQSRGAEALELLNRLAAEDPDWVAPRQMLAEVHFRGGDSASAGPHVDWLTLRNVVTPRLALIAGAVALERRELQAALVELEYAAHTEPTLAGVASLLGTVQMRLGRWDAAEGSFAQAARQNPSDARALDGLAAVALHHRQFEDAADWALKALQQDMGLFRAHYHLGIALAHLNRPEAAAEAFATCARLDPTRAAPLVWLSRIANERGDAAGAAEYRQRAQELIRQRRARH